MGRSAVLPPPPGLVNVVPDHLADLRRGATLVIRGTVARLISSLSRSAVTQQEPGHRVKSLKRQSTDRLDPGGSLDFSRASESYAKQDVACFRTQPCLINPRGPVGEPCCGLLPDKLIKDRVCTRQKKFSGSPCRCGSEDHPVRSQCAAYAECTGCAVTGAVRGRVFSRAGADAQAQALWKRLRLDKARRGQTFNTGSAARSKPGDYASMADSPGALTSDRGC